MKRSVLIVITPLVALFAALWMAGLAGASRSAELLAPASPAADAGLTADEGVIAYVKRSTGDIHVISPDGTNDRLLWTNPDPDHTPIHLAWRPDGRELAFSSQHEWTCSFYDSDVYAIRSDGTGYRRITNAPACAELAGLPKGVGDGGGRKTMFGDVICLRGGRAGDQEGPIGHHDVRQRRGFRPGRVAARRRHRRAGSRARLSALRGRPAGPDGAGRNPDHQ